jgi:hypothetical protein
VYFVICCEHEGMQSRNTGLMVIFPPMQARVFAKDSFLAKDRHPIGGRILRDHGAEPGKYPHGVYVGRPAGQAPPHGGVTAVGPAGDRPQPGLVGGGGRARRRGRVRGGRRSQRGEGEAAGPGARWPTIAAGAGRARAPGGAVHQRAGRGSAPVRREGQCAGWGSGGTRREAARSLDRGRVLLA